MYVNTFPARGPSSSASNKLTSWVCVNRILDHTDKAIRLQIVSAVGLMGTLLICLIVLYFTGLANDMLLLNKFSTVKNIDIFLHEVYWAGQYTSRFTWNIHRYVILSWNLFALEKKGFKVCLLYLFCPGERVTETVGRMMGHKIWQPCLLREGGGVMYDPCLNLKPFHDIFWMVVLFYRCIKFL